jgi:GNAT superfamily N-acetyltransferase
MSQIQSEVMRSFNRAYTSRIGVLEDSFLGSGRPVGVARLLFEIGPGGSSVLELRQRLGLDSGYISRLLRSLEGEGLVTVVADPGDSRRRLATLTPTGQTEWRDLERRSQALAEQILNRLGDRQRGELVAALATAERLVRAATLRFEPVDARGTAARDALRRYFNELDQVFESGFDPGDATSADAPLYDPPAGLFLVARNDTSAVACGGFIRHDNDIAELKRMWVDPHWRGLGIGRRMLAELERGAVLAGYRSVVLDTNSRLNEAIAMYSGAGYRSIDRYNDNPYAQRWFAKDLVPVIEPWADDDHHGVIELIVPIQRLEFGLSITLEDQPDLLDVPAFYRRPGGEFWVARWGREVVGTVAVLYLDERTLVLRKMFVSPDQRGAGLAATLLDTVVSWAKRRGFQSLVLGTTTEMQGAHRFYARQGFQQVNETDLPAGFPRMAIDSVFFERDLIAEPRPTA